MFCLYWDLNLRRHGAQPASLTARPQLWVRVDFDLIIYLLRKI